ncbi:MAG: hypothetical protein HYV09_36900 [Deltaproteobacteria bacterium]|nr:hypothetical protein [Deltaproteobacteria bacterium]
MVVRRCLVLLVATAAHVGCTYDFDAFMPSGAIDSDLVDDTSSGDAVADDAAAPLDSAIEDVIADANVEASDDVSVETSADTSADTAADTSADASADGSADTGGATDTGLVDTATPDVPVSCPDPEGKALGTHCYFPLAADNWDKAKAGCEARGAHLVTITSAAEEIHVESIRTGKDRWLGLRRPAGSPIGEGSFAWITTESVTFKKWGGGQPSGAGECAVLRAGNDWADLGCKSPRDPICERD